MLQAAAAEGSKNKKKGKKKLSATGVSNGGIIESAGPSTAAGSITHGDEVTYFFFNYHFINHSKLGATLK